MEEQKNLKYGGYRYYSLVDGVSYYLTRNMTLKD